MRRGIIVGVGLAVIGVVLLAAHAVEKPTTPSVELEGGKVLAAEVFQTEAEAELLSVDTLSEGSEKPWGLVLRWKPKSGGLDQGTDQTNQRLCARLASQPSAFFQSVIIAAVLESGVGVPPFAVSSRAVQYCVWGVPVEAQEIRHILRGLSSW